MKFSFLGLKKIKGTQKMHFLSVTILRIGIILIIFLDSIGVFPWFCLFSIKNDFVIAFI